MVFLCGVGAGCEGGSHLKFSKSVFLALGADVLRIARVPFLGLKRVQVWSVLVSSVPPGCFVCISGVLKRVVNTMVQCSPIGGSQRMCNMSRNIFLGLKRLSLERSPSKVVLSVSI